MSQTSTKVQFTESNQPAPVADIPPRALLGDRIAILLSGLCVAHCLAMPLLLSFIPWLAWMHESEHMVHQLLLLSIMPLSTFTLLRGCAKHARHLTLWLGAIACTCLLSAVLLSGIPHSLEMALTVLGSTALIGSHLINMRAIRSCAVGRF